MPRDAGDDAYAWMAARERAATTVETGSTWRHRLSNRKVTVTNGGFLPSYEADDSRVRYRYVIGSKRIYELAIEQFMKRFKERA